MERIPPDLPPDVFEALVEALAQALVTRYREQHGGTIIEQAAPLRSPPVTAPRTSLTVHDAALRACCGDMTIYREVAAKRLRAVRVGGRKSLRFRAEWIDAWLEGGGSAL
jgi:excisionase family DNA binding protein